MVGFTAVQEFGALSTAFGALVSGNITFADRNHYLRAVLGTGPGQGVLQQVDEETATEALLDAGEEFVQDDGAYRFENVFRIVAATPGDEENLE